MIESKWEIIQMFYPQIFQLRQNQNIDETK